MKIEKSLLSLFKKTDNLILFEIGSCNGADTVKYANLFPYSKLYAFEPIPDNFLKLTKKLTENHANNVSAFQLAMSNATGDAKMFVSSIKDQSPEIVAEQSSSLLTPDKHLDVYPWCNFDNEIIVKTDTIENFCKAQKITAIDFVHLDVQGAELLVLDGAASFLNNIKSIWLEVEHISLYKRQPLRRDVETYMSKNGFVLTKFRVGGYSGDQFYVNKNFLKKKSWLTLPFALFKSGVLRNRIYVGINRLFRKIRFMIK